MRLRSISALSGRCGAGRYLSVLATTLPDIAAIDMENDSIVRLNCRNHSGYIILRKNTAHEVK